VRRIAVLMAGGAWRVSPFGTHDEDSACGLSPHDSLYLASVSRCASNTSSIHCELRARSSVRRTITVAGLRCVKRSTIVFKATFVPQRRGARTSSWPSASPDPPPPRWAFTIPPDPDGSTLHMTLKVVALKRWEEGTRTLDPGSPSVHARLSRVLQVVLQSALSSAGRAARQEDRVRDCA